MALNISLFWLGWPIFLAALIIVVILIIVLTVVERRIHKRVEIKKTLEQTYYQRRLGAIKALKKDEDILNSIDEVAKEFFEEKYGKTNQKAELRGAEALADNFFKDELQISQNQSYSDLVEFFRKRNDSKAIEFSKAMTETLYSGEKLNKIKLDKLYKLLEEVIGEKPIPGQVDMNKVPVKTGLKDAPVRGVSKAPIKQISDVRTTSEIDKNSEAKIKMILQNRKPMEPVKSQIDINREKIESKERTIEILDQNKESKINSLVVSSAQTMPVKKKGFFARLFGKKDEQTATKQVPESRPVKAIPMQELNKVNMNLVRYIAEGTKRGFEISLLKGKLTEAGFKKEDVEAAAHYFAEKRAEKMSPAIKNNLVQESPEIQSGKKVEEKSPEKPIYEAFPQKEENTDKKENEHKSILERFFQPKNAELASIKKEVESGGAMKPSEPLVREREMLNAPKKIKEQGNVESMDNLDRVKEKIQRRQEILARQGYEGAELAKIK